METVPHTHDARAAVGPNPSGHPSAKESLLVVASNRGPVSFERDEHGKLVPRRGIGGLVTALSGVLFRDATWVASAITDGDREIAKRGRAASAGAGQRVRFVQIDHETYDGYYNQISNQILWFAHHYLFDVARTPRFGDDTVQAWERFVEVNQAFADVLAREADRHPVYLIQDYHLALVPAMLRERVPDARIIHFSHTPIAGPSYMRILPARMREAVIRGMCGADLLGFQSPIWAENFALNVRSTPGLRIDLRTLRARDDARTIPIRSFPVAVPGHVIRETAARPDVVEAAQEIEDWRGEPALLLRVDRLEPSKNIIRGFLAFELFLKQHPEWVGRVKFLSLLSPSREEMQDYQRYGEEALAEAERINKAFGTAKWKPIDVRVQEDFHFAVAAYTRYDVLLVNPVYDGMNLVCMEGPLVNERQGVLALSVNAGAYTRVGRHALGLNPFDIQETADAIRQGLEMPAEERARRARGLTRSILAHSPETWLLSQLDELDLVRPPAAGSDHETAQESDDAFGSFNDEVGI
ncbi:MAG: trehalose 6-phosphate synthase [Actinomycetota bacterium]|nr:trehalose 6-phosphate synthase [Actinomycetota bacterium]